MATTGMLVPDFLMASAYWTLGVSGRKPEGWVVVKYRAVFMPQEQCSRSTFPSSSFTSWMESSTVMPSGSTSEAENRSSMRKFFPQRSRMASRVMVRYRARFSREPPNSSVRLLNRSDRNWALSVAWPKWSIHISKPAFFTISAASANIFAFWAIISLGISTLSRPSFFRPGLTA